MKLQRKFTKKLTQTFKNAIPPPTQNMHATPTADFATLDYSIYCNFNIFSNNYRESK